MYYYFFRVFCVQFFSFWFSLSSMGGLSFRKYMFYMLLASRSAARDVSRRGGAVGEVLQRVRQDMRRVGVALWLTLRPCA